MAELSREASGSESFESVSLCLPGSVFSQMLGLPVLAQELGSKMQRLPLHPKKFPYGNFWSLCARPGASGSSGCSGSVALHDQIACGDVLQISPLARHEVMRRAIAGAQLKESDRDVRAHDDDGAAPGCIQGACNLAEGFR